MGASPLLEEFLRSLLVVSLPMEREPKRVDTCLAIWWSLYLVAPRAGVKLTILLSQFLQGSDLVIHFLKILNRQFGVVFALLRAELIVIHKVLRLVIVDDSLLILHLHKLWGGVFGIFFGLNHRLAYIGLIVLNNGLNNWIL